MKTPELSFADAYLSYATDRHDSFRGPVSNMDIIHAYINAGVLPPDIMEQILGAGIVVERLHPGQIHDMVLACRHDRTLIDDKNGTTLLDMFSLTPYEQQEMEASQFQWRNKISEERTTASQTTELPAPHFN